VSCLGHLQSSLSRPRDWKTTTDRCTSMLIQNMAFVVVFELHRTCSHSLSGCIGHGFPLVFLQPRTCSIHLMITLSNYQRSHETAPLAMPKDITTRSLGTCTGFQSDNNPQRLKQNKRYKPGLTFYKLLRM
jgi:hypothetical protein